AENPKLEQETSKPQKRSSHPSLPVLTTQPPCLISPCSSHPAYLICFKISLKKSSKLSVIYPSLSSSYFLNTSVILLSEIQACTNRSKLMTPSPLLSYVLNSSSTKPGVRRYRNATSALVNSSREM